MRDAQLIRRDNCFEVPEGLGNLCQHLSLATVLDGGRVSQAGMHRKRE
jgi:hypothetical protein